MRKLYFPVVLLATILLALFAYAEGTRTWEQTKYEELEKGTLKGVAVRSIGGLELAPSFKQLYTTPSTYIWAIADDAQGNVYAAAGAPARVYKITPDGQASIIFQPQELQVQALLVDKSGAIYAATSPDGKVYKIERKAGVSTSAPAPKKAEKKSDKNSKDTEEAKAGPEEEVKAPAVDSSYTSSVYFDPKTKYIWDLAADNEGRLYIATGDHGEIYRVERGGAGSVFFKSDEPHIRVLAFDSKGNVLAGTDGSGLIYRISPAGEAFVLYSAPKKEITALAVDSAGNIYASGVGEKHAGSGFGGVSLPAPAPTLTITSGITTAVTSAPNVPQIPFPAMGATGGSEVYQIAPDGSPKRIWNSRDDVVYCLGFDAAGQLVAGTGNKARIFSIRDNGDYTDLVKASATQVTALAKAPGGGLYAATSNLGKVFRLGPAPDTDGSYESDVFDAHIFSRWGRAEVLGRGNFELFARSGNVDNPDRNWSPWKKIDFARGGELDVPPARFVQWKAVLHPGNPVAVVDNVTVNYLPKNVAPDIDDIAVQPGARFNPVPKVTNETVTINVGGSNTPQPTTVPRFEAPIPAVKDSNSIAVRWSAHDDNDDDLVYSLYYKGDGETRWKLLKDNIDDKFYSFDAALLPDGGYTVKVIASDAPSHSPDDALSASRESARFEVDSTPPQVQNLNATVDAGTLHVTFRALDGFSPIKRAEYSVDAGDWQFVEPVGHLSDYRVENYDFSIPLPKSATAPAPAAAPAVPVKGDGVSAANAAAADEGNASEHVVVVRAYDRFDNMGAAKFVVKPK
ncbi:MAG TPA: hypothetical protein VFU76_10115 [Terriglobales bacterium]|nr:hypothetical protein [Terriglobales bacterium]